VSYAEAISFCLFLFSFFTFCRFSLGRKPDLVIQRYDPNQQCSGPEHCWLPEDLLVETTVYLWVFRPAWGTDNTQNSNWFLGHTHTQIRVCWFALLTRGRWFNLVETRPPVALESGSLPELWLFAFNVIMSIAPPVLFFSIFMTDTDSCRVDFSPRSAWPSLAGPIQSRSQGKSSKLSVLGKSFHITCWNSGLAYSRLIHLYLVNSVKFDSLPTNTSF